MPQDISRRRLLLVAAGAAGASLFDVLPLRAEDVPGPQREYGWFPMGIQSYSLRDFDVDRALELIRELGLHQVEFFGAHFPIDPDPEKIGAMLKKVRRQEIAISAHGVNHFSGDHDANRRIFDFANLAGIRNISADPDPDSFDSLDKLVAEYGIRIAIHNHGPGHRYSHIADVKKAIEGHHEWVGACADIGHFIRSGEDPVRVVRELAGRLYGIHLKDFDAPKGDAKGVVLGKGVLELVPFFRALREARFPADGAISLEYEENPKDPVPEIRECLEAAASAAQRAMGG